MNYSRSILVLLIVGITLLSCGNNTAADTAAKAEGATQTEQQHHEPADAIELNNGEKWTVNDEMKPYLSKGQELVSTFAKNNGTNYLQLAGELETQNKLLIKSCTMKGKSHDELHKWLHPHLELVKQLGITKDTTEALKLVAALEKSYLEFDNYFK